MMKPWKLQGRFLKREYALTDFNGISVTSAFKVYITFSETEEGKIVVQASDNLQDKIDVEVKEGVLSFDLKRNTGIRGDIVLNVFITTSNLGLLNVAGVSEVILENRLEAESFEMNVSDSGNVYGEVGVQSMRLNLSGTSDVNLIGNVETLKAGLNNSSDLNDFDFHVEHLEIKLQGLSETSLTVHSSLVVEASGSSTLNYLGNPTIEQQTILGLAKVIKKD